MKKDNDKIRTLPNVNSLSLYNSEHGISSRLLSNTIFEKNKSNIRKSMLSYELFDKKKSESKINRKESILINSIKESIYKNQKRESSKLGIDKMRINDIYINIFTKEVGLVTNTLKHLKNFKEIENEEEDELISKKKFLITETEANQSHWDNPPTKSTYKTLKTENTIKTENSKYPIINKVNTHYYSPKKSIKLNLNVTEIEDNLKHFHNFDSSEIDKKLSYKRSSILDKRSSSKYNRSNIVNIKENKTIYYCPYCPHCNPVKESFISKMNHLSNNDNINNLNNQSSYRDSQESKTIKNKGRLSLLDIEKDSNTYSKLNVSTRNILNKAVDYILNKKDLLDDFNLFSPQKDIDEIEVLSDFPKNSYNNRIIYTALGIFLIAIKENKVDLSEFLSHENISKFNSSLLSSGLAYGYSKDLFNKSLNVNNLSPTHKIDMDIAKIVNGEINDNEREFFQFNKIENQNILDSKSKLMNIKEVNTEREKNENFVRKSQDTNSNENKKDHSNSEKSDSLTNKNINTNNLVKKMYFKSPQKNDNKQKSSFKQINITNSSIDSTYNNDINNNRIFDRKKTLNLIPIKSNIKKTQTKHSKSMIITKKLNFSNNKDTSLNKSNHNSFKSIDSQAKVIQEDIPTPRKKFTEKSKNRWSLPKNINIKGKITTFDKTCKTTLSKIKSFKIDLSAAKNYKEDKNQRQSNSPMLSTEKRQEGEYVNPKKLYAAYNLKFDSEIEELLDEETKKNIYTILMKSRIKQEVVKEKLITDDLDKLSNQRMKSLTYYLIFFQILSEFSSECKERAYLLYTFFKVYFAEQETKFSKVIQKLYDKIKFYKDLCKLIVQQKHKHLDKIEEISDILLTQKVSFNNLNNHKKLIQDLLNIINEKREEIYVLNSDISILKRELKLFILDFDTLKLNEHSRKALKALDRKKIMKNVHEEMKYKKVSKIQEILLANSDIFLILSGQRSYFYDQKEYYLNEIEKLKKQYTYIFEEKRNIQLKYFETDLQLKISTERMSNEIEELRKMIMTDYKVGETQTEIDYYEFNLMKKNHDNVMYASKKKRFSIIRDYIDNVLYETSKFDPISLSSLKKLIIEVYDEKVKFDDECDSKNIKRPYLDDFFQTFMKDRFKIDSVVKDCCEKTIASIIKYSDEDKKIEYFKRFLSIDDSKSLRRQVLDIYLLILKSLPFEINVFFSEEFNVYFANVDLLIDLVLLKFEHLSLGYSCQNDIFSRSSFVDNQVSNKKLEISSREKLIFYVLNRFYNRSQVFFSLKIKKIQEEFSNKPSTINNLEIPVSELIDQIKFCNKGITFDMEAVLKKLLSVFGSANNLSKQELISKLYDINLFTFKSKNENESVSNVEKSSSCDSINLSVFINFFKTHNASIKIKISDFIQIILDKLIEKFSLAEKRICMVYDAYDPSKRHLISTNILEELFCNILGEKMWRVSDFFLYKDSSLEREFITEEEFINYCLDYKPLISEFVKEDFKLNIKF